MTPAYWSGRYGVLGRLIAYCCTGSSRSGLCLGVAASTNLRQLSGHTGALSSRTADLEALLSDTDESVAQSAAALGAQLRVVDKETRRLEQRRRELDSRIDKLEKAKHLKGRCHQHAVDQRHR